MIGVRAPPWPLAAFPLQFFAKYNCDMYVLVFVSLFFFQLCVYKNILFPPLTKHIAGSSFGPN